MIGNPSTAGIGKSSDPIFVEDEDVEVISLTASSPVPVARTSGPRRVSPPRLKGRSRQPVGPGVWASRGEGHVLGGGGGGGGNGHGRTATNLVSQVEYR